jgi:hypothetical protein
MSRQNGTSKNQVPSTQCSFLPSGEAGSDESPNPALLTSTAGALAVGADSFPSELSTRGEANTAGR